MTITFRDSCTFNSVGDVDIFDARFKNMRFKLQVQRRIQVTAGLAANLPGISHKYMGSQEFWWVIQQFNGIIDPIEDVTVGTYINIPVVSEVMALLETPTVTESANSNTTYARV